jgi:plastocyanin
MASIPPTALVRSRVPLAAVVGVSLAVCLTAGIAIAATRAVSVQGFAFHPGTVTVNVGDTVTWTNNDGVQHTATANSGAFDTDAISPGSSKSVTFHSAGTFAYHCEIHPSMHGTVVVRVASAGGGPATDTIGSTSNTASVRGGGIGISDTTRTAFVLLAGTLGAVLAVRRVRRAAGSRSGGSSRA